MTSNIAKLVRKMFLLIRPFDPSCFVNRVGLFYFALQTEKILFFLSSIMDKKSPPREQKS